MNEITDADRKAADRIWMELRSRPEGSKIPLPHVFARIIADSRPEPSPDAEALADKIAVAIYKDDSFHPRAFHAVKKLLRPLLTPFLKPAPKVEQQQYEYDVKELLSAIKHIHPTAHYCPEWDGMLIYPTMGEWDACLCAIKKKAPKLDGDVGDTVELLRKISEGKPPQATLYSDAADTIEALSEKLATIKRQEEINACFANDADELSKELAAKLARAEARVENLEATLDGRSDEQALREDTP